jgi:hypothetical protein
MWLPLWEMIDESKKEIEVPCNLNDFKEDFERRQKSSQADSFCRKIIKTIPFRDWLRFFRIWILLCASFPILPQLNWVERFALVVLLREAKSLDPSLMNTR